MKLLASSPTPRPSSVTSVLAEPTDVPARSPSLGPPYWKSVVLRRKAFGEVA